MHLKVLCLEGTLPSKTSRSNMDNLRELAQRIIDNHQPTSFDSWASCKACGQTHRGASETFPVWPCDARALADKVLEDN
jgi:hypothetical protein